MNQLILKGLWFFFLQMVYWTFNRSQRQSLPLLVFFQSGLKVIPSPLHLNGAIPCDDFDTRYPECCNKRQGNSHKFNKKSCMTKTIVRSKNEAKEKKRASLWQEYVQKCTVIAIPKRWVEMPNFKFVLSLGEVSKKPTKLKTFTAYFFKYLF